MILKLTNRLNEAVLIDTGCISINTHRDGGSLVSSAIDSRVSLFVKETVDEILQQIKEGGITNGTN